MRAIVALGLAAALCGCVSNHRTYLKPGAGEEELQRTFAGCKAQAAMVPGTDVWSGMVASDMIDNCMRANGFVRKT